MSTTPAIEVKNVHKKYKKIEVLKDVSFTIAKGEIYALLGANGAGKSTTINILSTLTHADAGVVMVDGVDINKNPAKVREFISLTGQFAAVDELLTGRENLEMIGSLYRLKKDLIATRTTSLLETFGLTEAAQRQAGTYSGGMRRKLDLAISLIANPAIIFLDEPTTGLAATRLAADGERLARLRADLRPMVQRSALGNPTDYVRDFSALMDRVAARHKLRRAAPG